MEKQTLSGRNVLIVEDVELNQYLARHIMESWGCRVKVVGDGALALEEVKKDDFDLILMDIQMPVMDGMEATKQIRALADTWKATVPIVALTANAVTGNIERYLNVGMNDCMLKPFEEMNLLKTVEKNIRRSRKETQNDHVTDNAAETAVKIHAANHKPTSEPSYKLTMIESVSGGDTGFVEKMLRLFLETVPVTLQAIEEAVADDNTLQLSKLAHKLKSTIDTLAIEELRADIRKIEADGKAGVDMKELTGLVSHVTGTMHLVMEQVRKDHGL